MSLDLNKVLAIGLPLIKRFEGLRLKPYLCSAGIPTIGYGSTYYPSGRKVTLADLEITEPTASSLLENTVNTTFLPGVITLCPGLKTENQAAAILSWTYNLGVGALRGSTLRKKINTEDWEAVPGEILKWDKAGGKQNLGLSKRRALEASIFVT
jgi:lysozyme